MCTFHQACRWTHAVPAGHGGHGDARQKAAHGLAPLCPRASNKPRVAAFRAKGFQRCKGKINQGLLAKTPVLKNCTAWHEGRATAQKLARCGSKFRGESCPLLRSGAQSVVPVASCALAALRWIRLIIHHLDRADPRFTGKRGLWKGAGPDRGGRQPAPGASASHRRARERKRRGPGSAAGVPCPGVHFPPRGGRVYEDCCAGPKPKGAQGMSYYAASYWIFLWGRTERIAFWPESVKWNC